MKIKLLISINILIYLFINNLLLAQNSLQLPKLFCDNMVLQREINVPVWGKANPNEEVTVQFLNQKKVIKADENGKWRVELFPLKAGGPFELLIFTKDTIKIKNVLVGEVWVCSGQSNMNMPLAGWGQINNYKEEIKNANYPNIRLFTVEQISAPNVAEDCNSKGWFECSPASIPEFSSIAYFYGRELYNKLKIPIGLINSSVGGTKIEAWTSKEMLNKYGKLDDPLEKMKNYTQTDIDKIAKDYKKTLVEWNKEAEKNDLGLSEKWMKEGMKFDDWKTMTIPSEWDKNGYNDFDGVIWFKKNINISNEFLTDSITLKMPRVEESIKVYVNGELVFEQRRKNFLSEFTFDAKKLRSGLNEFTLRIFDQTGKGGMWDSAFPFELTNEKNESVLLSGDWNFKVGLDLKNISALPKDPRVKDLPSGLFNGMIAPLINFAIRGVIWYQGESNINNAFSYRKLLPNLITDWRSLWKQGEFPFYYVQLANHLDIEMEPKDNKHAELREAQTMTLKLKNTGMACLIDLGEINDVHPKNKQESGRRLALVALNKTYNLKNEYSGPTYRSYKVEKDKIVISFDNISKSLVVKGDELKGFVIAGEDKVFKWAEAKLEGDKVIVWNESIPNPIAVRYAWASNPVCNLYNSTGLPAVPFRTDDFPGITR